MRRAFVTLVLCLGVASSFPLLAADPPPPEHAEILDVVVEQILGGRTDGVRVVATPLRIEPDDDVAFRWTRGDVRLPPGTAWFALADETPGVLGFHPVVHVFFDRDLRILETRRAVFYPRVYYEGTRRGLTTLLAFRPEPGSVPPDREPATVPDDDRGVDTEYSYDDFYAVIIEGDVPAGASYSEFWSDPVRMFRMLLEYGYEEDHIHVLYGEGFDEDEFACEYYRERMVDFPAYQQDVRDLFTWMRDGNSTHGIDEVTSDDFIFLFTFDHGSGNASFESNLCLMDGCMPDTEFASYFDQIAYKHRAVDMQQCNSGGFIDNLENTTTVISTAAKCDESAYQADERDDCGGGVDVKYGEWNYWWIAAMQSQKPWPGFEPVDADTNDDGKISFLEAHNYALANDDRSEHPQWSDPGGIGDDLSLDTRWEGAHLTHVDHTLNDEGNGDGAADAGETHQMPVTLNNVGEEDASGITATLTTDSPWVEILDDHAEFPDMARQGGAGESLPDHYRWRSLDDTPDATEARFFLEWSSNGGLHSGGTHFAERIVRVDLTVQQTSIDDEAGGDGDGMADAGESVRLAVTLRNRGHADARNVEGTLSTSSEWATITDAEASFVDVLGLGSGRSEDPHFGVTIEPDTPDKTWIECTLDVTAADGYSESLPLRFIVGSRGSVLLIEDGDVDDADEMETTIAELGFAVVRETASATDPESWLGHSLVVWCAGENTDSISDEASRDALEDFVADGGRLLLEGGELGYDHRHDTSFRENVLHMASWTAHGGGDIATFDLDHPLTSVPTVLDETIELDAPENAQRDAVTPTTDARAVLDWSSRPGKASVLAFDDDDLEGNGGQIVDLFVQATSIDDAHGQRTAIVDNALEWLVGNDLPYLIFDGFTVDDAEFGNGDGIVDPGETIRLVVDLANRGSGEATNTWASACADAPGVATFADNYAAWPSIASGSSMASSAPHLVVRIANDAPCGSVVEVTLAITTDEGFGAERRFSFEVGTGGGRQVTSPGRTSPSRSPIRASSTRRSRSTERSEPATSTARSTSAIPRSA